MYAVLETGSKQYRVSAGDTLEIERLAVAAGEAVTFDRVLLVNNDGKLAVGSPTVANASIKADVVEHIRGDKKTTFKLKRRKGYRKKIGHRQELTVVRIREISSELGQSIAQPQSPAAEAQPPATAQEAPVSDQQPPAPAEPAPAADPQAPSAPQ
jgi:large subunit ribosomal protein L21